MVRIANLRLPGLGHDSGKMTIPADPGQKSEIRCQILSRGSDRLGIIFIGLVGKDHDRQMLWVIGVLLG